MKERENGAIEALNEKRFLDANEACYYLCLGYNRGVQLLKDIGAERKIGRRRIYDRVVIDKYFDSQIEEN